MSARPSAGVSAGGGVGAAAHRGVGATAPAARHVAEVPDHELRRPAEVAGREDAEAEGVALHQALHAAARGAVLAVAVDEAEAAPTAAAGAPAAGVLVGAAEDVAGLVREHAVDVVRAPAVVVVVHDDARAADARVREV